MIRFLLLILLCASNLAKADAKQDASDVVNKMRPSINAGIKGGVDFKGSGDLSIKDMINYKGTDIKETAYKDQATREAAIAAMQKEENDARDVVNTSFLRQKEYKIDKNSPIWDNAKQAQAHPERYVDWIKGNYQDCKQDGADAMLSKEHKVCDEYHAIEERSCIMGRAIVVDSKHKYECTKSLDKIFKRCTKNLVVSRHAINCPVDDISSTGVIRKEGQTLSLVTNYVYTKKRGYSSGSSTITIPSGIDISEAIIEEISFVSPAEITFNGQQLIADPMSFQMLISALHNKVSFKKGVLQNWRKVVTKVTNKDIRHLLRAGANTFSISSMVDGSVTFKIRITKKCEVEKDEWVENCTEVKGAL